jgi:hypothetical protein
MDYDTKDYYDLDAEERTGIEPVEMILVCDKCGGEGYQKLIGDEAYDWCEWCGDIEGASHEEPAE